MNVAMVATLVLVGLLTGWLAGFAMQDGGHGRTWDLALGLVGSTVAGGLFAILGTAEDVGIFVAAMVAFAGAAVLIIAQRQIWSAHAS
jgi:uncharacterized membrane protein YeaQ/YmgE (transglycosylase-associated protein family)